MKYLSPLLPVFIACFAADPLINAWRFIAVIASVVLAYWLGIIHGDGK